MLNTGSSAVGCAYGFFLRKFPEEGKAMRQQIIDWYVEGKIKPAIGHLFSLDDAPLAMKEMEERRIQGKALVVTDAFRERHPDVDLETFSTLDAAGSARL